MTDSFWRKCTTCKKPIPFGQKYWICSVSTCNRARTDLVFCNLSCFDAHVPVMNHRDAGAFEKRAPAQGQAVPTVAAQNAQVPAEQQPRQARQAPQERLEEAAEILVVVSKVKQYIRSHSGGSQMNTSEAVMEVLSTKIRGYLDDAIRSAVQNGRKTVLDRDLP